MYQFIVSVPGPPLRIVEPTGEDVLSASDKVDVLSVHEAKRVKEKGMSKKC